MQVLNSAPPNFWIDLSRSPAVILGAIAVLVRWVIAPAVSTYNRRELAPELAQLAQVKDHSAATAGRVDNLERIVESLEGVPEAVARVEEQLKTLLKAPRPGALP